MKGLLRMNKFTLSEWVAIFLAATFAIAFVIAMVAILIKAITGNW